MSCAGKAADGQAAVIAAKQHKTDVILMDIRMPGVDGLTATRRITATLHWGTPRSSLLTTFELDEYVFDALRCDRRRLVISPATARTHLGWAMIKLSARDRSQLVVFAYQSGLDG